MKKLVSAILSVTIIFTLATCGFAAGKTPSSVVIEADESFTNPIYINSEKVAQDLYSLITKAKRASLKVSQVTELAKLAFDRYMYNGKLYSEDYTVYKAADGSLYTMKNNKLYKLNLDADKFYNLVDESDIRFYKFRSIPTAKISGSVLCMSSSSYKFKKLDGIFYATQFEPSDEIFGEFGVGVIQTPSFSAEPKSVKVAVINSDKKNVWSGDISKAREFEPEKAGTYTVRYTAIYESPYYSGEVVYEYEPHLTVQGISFSAEGLAKDGNSVITAPGEAVVLSAANVPENEKISFKSNINFTPSFFSHKSGDMAALLPINYYTAPGSYYVEMSCGGVTQRFTVEVRSKKFAEQYLTVPPATADATINSKKADDEYEKYIAPIRGVSDDKQYWSGRFIWPLKTVPRRTTEFGAVRYINGDMKNPSRHGGIDFAAAAGTPVYAPAAGRVLYSGNLQLTGNTICIEHGYGLKTWYYHMNGRTVKTGDMVKQGQHIGIVGSTGFSTGAHLHYAMSVSNAVSGNVYINPETAVTTDMFSISEYALEPIVD